TITIVSPPQVVSANDISTVDQAALNQATQDAIQAAQDTQFTRPPEGSGRSTGEPTSTQETTTENNQGSPNAQNQDYTTSGDGGSGSNGTGDGRGSGGATATGNNAGGLPP